MDSNKLYAPLVVAYENGEYRGFHEFIAPQPTLAACEAANAQALAEITSSGTLPPTAAIGGICVEVPRTLQPKNHGSLAKPLTNADGSQTL